MAAAAAAAVAGAGAANRAAVAAAAVVVATAVAATAVAVAVAATPLLTAEHVAALEGSWRRAAQLRAELAASTAGLPEGERQLVSPAP